MSFDDNHQYIIAIPNGNGESQAFFFTPEVLPEQLIPLVQKKHLKEEKLDYSNLNPVYKKFLENLSESQGSSNLGSIIDASGVVNLGEKTKTSNTDSSVDNRSSKNSNSATPSIIRNLQTNLNTGSTTFLLQTSNLNQNSQNLSTTLSSDQTVISENSSNYITTLQISQNSSNLPTLAFNQPQALLHYSKQNQDSANTVLIPISLQSSNQYTQQQILVATGGYNQNCSDGVSNTISANSNHNDSINVTSLAKLISSNSSNPLSISLNTNANKSNSSCSEISPNSKIISKSKPGLMNNEEFGKRKEIRLLKNREAAKECRRKKKEYVKCLESRVKNLEEQNKILVDEINRMKEIFSKKSSKPTLHLINSDKNKKFIDIYSSDSTMKDDMFDSVHEDNDQGSLKDKSYSIPVGLVSIAGITQPNPSDSNNFLIAKSKQNASHADHPHINLNAIGVDKDASNLFLKFKKDTNSALSLLLTSDHGHKQYSQPVYESNAIIFPENVQETNPNDFSNSRNTCDLN